ATSAESLQAFLDALVADSPIPFTTYTDWAVVRANVSSGRWVLDPAGVASCLAAPAELRRPRQRATFYAHDPRPNPCAEVARPRCPVGLGSPCAYNVDCGPLAWCLDPHGCQLTGT